MMFTKKNVLYSTFAFFLILSLSSCIALSGDAGKLFSGKPGYKIAFESGDYNSGLKEMKDALQISTIEEKPKLQRRYSKILFSYAWKKFEDKAIDDSFKLVFTGKEYATDEFLKSKPFLAFGLTYGERYNKISHIFAQYHINSAHIALESPDLKLALDEFQIASKATNDIGQQSREEFIKWSEERSNLKLKLDQANEAINQEHYAKSKALIDHVRQSDISLQSECVELTSHLHEQQHNSIIRDAQILLDKNMFVRSFNKANEAMLLKTDSLEVENIKTKIQGKFATYIKGDKDEALTNDKRHQLILIAKKFEQLEMLDDRDVLEKIVQDRSEADSQLETARVEIVSGRQESAIVYLREASDLWPENKNIKDLYKQTCLYVANLALKKAKKAIHQNCPMLGLLWCIKALTVGPQEKVIISQSDILIKQASRLIDQTSMEFRISVNINFDQDVNTIVDTQKLQKKIALLIPQDSRFVRVALPNENISINTKAFTVDVDIKDFTINTEKKMFHKAVRYVSYVANDPNPDYIELQAQLTAAQDKMASAQISYQQAVQMRNQAIQRQRAIGSGGSGLFNLLNAGSMVVGTFGMKEAKDDLSSANYEYKTIANYMSNTSPTVPRNVYADYQYVVEEYRRTGLLKVIVKFINPENRILMQKLITETYNKSDQAHDGYSPADLSRDPLELNTEEEIGERFTQRIFSDVPEIVSFFVSDYWDGILKNIEREPKTFTRWERRLVLALQVPSLKERILDEISKAEINLPNNLIGEIASILEN